MDRFCSRVLCAMYDCCTIQNTGWNGDGQMLRWWDPSIDRSFLWFVFMIRSLLCSRFFPSPPTGWGRQADHASISDCIAWRRSPIIAPLLIRSVIDPIRTPISTPMGATEVRCAMCDMLAMCGMLAMAMSDTQRTTGDIPSSPRILTYLASFPFVFLVNSTILVLYPTELWYHVYKCKYIYTVLAPPILYTTVVLIVYSSSTTPLACCRVSGIGRRIESKIQYCNRLYIIYSTRGLHEACTNQEHFVGFWCVRYATVYVHTMVRDSRSITTDMDSATVLCECPDVASSVLCVSYHSTAVVRAVVDYQVQYAIPRSLVFSYL